MLKMETLSRIRMWSQALLLRLCQFPRVQPPRWFGKGGAGLVRHNVCLDGACSARPGGVQVPTEERATGKRGFYRRSGVDCPGVVSPVSKPNLSSLNRPDLAWCTSDGSGVGSVTYQGSPAVGATPAGKSPGRCTSVALLPDTPAPQDKCRSVR